jgi:hypothetical protein
MNKDKDENWMQIPDITTYLQEKEKPTDDLLRAVCHFFLKIFDLILFFVALCVVG